VVEPPPALAASLAMPAAASPLDNDYAALRDVLLAAG
jgi:threonine synthase